eukprot:scaffold22929_cov32-Tisochrysis_lutea.AAC.3
MSSSIPPTVTSSGPNVRASETYCRALSARVIWSSPGSDCRSEYMVARGPASAVASSLCERKGSMGRATMAARCHASSTFHNDLK